MKAILHWFIIKLLNLVSENFQNALNYTHEHNFTQQSIDGVYHCEVKIKNECAQFFVKV